MYVWVTSPLLTYIMCFSASIIQDQNELNYKQKDEPLTYPPFSSIKTHGSASLTTYG